MRLGILARDDQGGLGNLTRDVFLNLRPDVTVVVQTEPRRGTPHPETFEEAWTETYRTNNPIPPQTWEKLAPKADVWWTAETWYCDQAENILNAHGKKSVLYAMPELFAGSEATEVWNPTDYLSSRHRLGKVVDWPTNVSDVSRLRTKVRRLLHISSEAVADRNGTQTFLEALTLVEEPCEVVVHCPDKNYVNVIKLLDKLPANKTVSVFADYKTSLSSLYNWADCLVMPRRYAGLCLPAFEAFSSGGLVLMPDVDPQVRWPICGVQASRKRPIAMKGGKIPVWNISSRDLADRISFLLNLSTPETVKASEKVQKWVQERSWETQKEKWRQLLLET